MNIQYFTSLKKNFTYLSYNLNIFLVKSVLKSTNKQDVNAIIITIMSNMIFNEFAHKW